MPVTKKYTAKSVAKKKLVKKTAKKVVRKKVIKGTVVAKAAVNRKKGMLYFVDASGNVRETKMNRKGGTKGRKVCAKK